MEILFVTRRFPPAPGGVEDQVMHIARRLVMRGHQITVYASDLYSDVPVQLLPSRKHEDCDGVEVRRYRAVPVPWRRTEGTSVTPGMLLTCLAETKLPSVVHCQGLNLVTVSASMLARLRKSRVICTTHTDPITGFGRLAAMILAEFDGVVALTEIERTRMLNSGLDESKIRLIPDGIDLEPFSSLPTRALFREKVRIEGHFVMYAGRIDARKGCDGLIEAVSLAQPRIGDCTTVFSGPDWGYRDYLQELSARRGVRTVFTGNLNPEDLRSALVGCDVFVLPSYAEAMGLSILEAMMCGAPVIATNVGGIPSIVHDEETGLLVPPGDPRSLAEAICRIVLDRQLSSRLIVNAKKLAATYSIDSTVSQLEDFYEHVSSNAE